MRPLGLVVQYHHRFQDVGLRLARKHGCPLILRVEALEVEEQRAWQVRGPRGGRLVSELGERRLIRQADAVSTVSDALARSVVRSGIPPDRVHAQPNGIDLDMFCPGPPLPDAELAVQGLRGRFLVGWVGGYRAHHGLTQVEEVVRRMQEVLPDATLCLVGTGPLRPSLEDVARRHPRALRLLPPVAQADVPAWLSSFDVCLQLADPSAGEHYSPLKVLEYLACGRPVVAPDFVTSHYLTDGRDAVLYRPGDAVDLVDGVSRLHADTALRERLGVEARRTAERRGSWGSSGRRSARHRRPRRCLVRPVMEHQIIALLRAEAKRELQVAAGRLHARVRPTRPGYPPIFLVGCPRSGTTLLFDLLQAHPEVVALPDEGHIYWSAYNHPRRHQWRSDVLEAGDATAAEHRYLDTTLARLGDGHPLDKTPKNVLRVPYLRAHYPDARLVLVVREGRSTVASLLEGWRRGKGASYLLPQRLRLRDYDSRIWRYVLPPEWRRLQGSELAHVATAQFEASTAAASAHLDEMDAIVRYEELVSNPVKVMCDLLTSLDLAPNDGVTRAARLSPQQPRGSISPPHPDKWRAVEDDLDPYRERIADAMAMFGYVDD